MHHLGIATIPAPVPAAAAELIATDVHTGPTTAPEDARPVITRLTEM
ncbi:hypothetical protein ACWD4N_34190 [Streptomyces sp. NPDC002586]